MADDVRDLLLEIRQGLTLMLETQRVMDVRLVAIEKACTAEHPPSPLVEPLRDLAAAVQQTELTLRDIEDAIQAQPAEIEAAIERALEGKGGQE